MTLSRYRRGSTVYSDGSYAPNRGQVSPQGALGYLKREMRRPNSPYDGVSRFGRDGQSDTRSGIAAGMMRQQDQRRGDNRPGNKNGGKGRQPYKNEGRPIVKGPKGNNGQTPNPNTPVEKPPPPTVNINENGTLDLPYNDAWSQSVLDAMQAMNSELLGLQGEEQTSGLDYSRANRDMDLQYQDMVRNALNENAGRGTAFSSAYGIDVGENARMYNNAKQDLITGHGQFKNQVGNKRLAIQNAFNEMLRRDVLTRAQEEMADEGNESPVVVNPPKKDNNGNKGNKNNGNKGNNKDNKNKGNKNNSNKDNKNKGNKNNKHGGKKDGRPADKNKSNRRRLGSR